MKIGNDGLNLIKEFEGCELTAYVCPSGIYTIGYGHTGDVLPGQTITQAEADKLLRDDCKRFETGVNNYTNVPLNQSQFDALICRKHLETPSLLSGTLLACYLVGGKTLFRKSGG